MSELILLLALLMTLIIVSFTGTKNVEPQIRTFYIIWVIVLVVVVSLLVFLKYFNIGQANTYMLITFGFLGIWGFVYIIGAHILKK
jgi:hypothetical protein